MRGHLRLLPGRRAPDGGPARVFVRAHRRGAAQRKPWTIISRAAAERLGEAWEVITYPRQAVRYFRTEAEAEAYAAHLGDDNIYHVGHVSF